MLIPGLHLHPQKSHRQTKEVRVVETSKASLWGCFGAACQCRQRGWYQMEVQILDGIFSGEREARRCWIT